ncbi:hypothetical protein CAC42_4162 [Sphaceloma murrayae]|uniref:Rhodopsin domain-containing protein n=1 Tax=Sphaceloma murrayae TaxID=2082308 RepID=A0A2K1QLE8_9PEZI|nr:hypothetical protein CAC42_4162 [Sphaceloma murrayae]
MSTQGADVQDNPRGEHAQQWTIAICVLALLCVVLRIVTRLFIVRNPGLDDIAVGVAWIFALGVTITISFQVQYGLGLRQDSLTPQDVFSLLQAFWASIWIYHLGLFFTKAALLLQYLRIFTQPWFRKTAWAIFGFVCLSSCWTIFGSIFSCIPVASFWDARVKGTCLPHAVTWYFNAGLNVFTDLLIIVLPMPVLKNLNMPFKQRMALMGVFALGGFVCIISFIRVRNLQEVAKTDDISYYNVSSAVWSAIEVDVGIICACLPSLKATATRFFPRIFSSALSNNYSGNPTANGYFANYNGTPRNGYGQHSTLASRGAEGRSSKMNHFGGNAAVGTYNTTITARPLSRSRSQTFGGGKTRYGNEIEMTKTYGTGRRTDSMPADGKIDVVTVVEQAVEHTRPGPGESPYVAGSGNSVKEGSDTGSERGLVPLHDFDEYERGRGRDGGYSPTPSGRRS